MRFGIALSQERSSFSSFSLHERESNEHASLQTLSPRSDSGNEPISGIPENADIFGFEAMESPQSASKDESPSTPQTDMLSGLVGFERASKP